MRLLLSLGVVVITLVIGGCSTSEEELSIGKFIDEETIEFEESKITDQDQIYVVKEIFDSEKEMTEQEVPSRLPDLVVRIDHKHDSTMVLASSIWFNDDATATYYRGLDHVGEKDLFIISKEDTERLQSILP